MTLFWLVDKDGNVVKEFSDKQDAYQYQNRIRPDTVLQTKRLRC